MADELLVMVPSRGRVDALRVMLAETLRLSTARTDVAVAWDSDDTSGYGDLFLEFSGEPRVKWHSGPRDSLSGWTNCLAVQYAGEYGAMASFGDDHLPCTEGWDRKLLDAISAMGGTGIAYGNDLLAGAALPTAPVISSDIVQCLGWFCLPELKHYYVDNVWKHLGEQAGCLAYLPDVIIRHDHFSVTGQRPDPTYAESIPSTSADEASYRAWLAGQAEGHVRAVRGLRS